jgi:hypothetical protein
VRSLIRTLVHVNTSAFLTAFFVSLDAWRILIPAQSNALIRAHLHVNPNELQQSEWNELCAQAYYVEQRRNDNQVKMLLALAAGIFGRRN